MTMAATFITNQMKPNDGYIMDGVNGPPPGWHTYSGANFHGQADWAPTISTSYGGPYLYENNNDGTWSLHHTATNPFYWVRTTPGLYRLEVDFVYGYTPFYTDGSGGSRPYRIEMQPLGEFTQTLVSGIPSGGGYVGSFDININTTAVRFNVASRLTVRKFKFYKIG